MLLASSFHTFVDAVVVLLWAALLWNLVLQRLVSADGLGAAHMCLCWSAVAFVLFGSPAHCLAAVEEHSLPDPSMGRRIVPRLSAVPL